MRLWVPDLKGESTELKAAAGQAAVRSVQFSPDNQKLLTASDDKAVKVWAVQIQIQGCHQGLKNITESQVFAKLPIKC